MTYEREPKREPKTSPQQPSRQEDEKGGRGKSQIDIDKLLASIHVDAVEPIVGSTVEAGPARADFVSADEATGAAVHPTMLLWAEHLDRAALAIDAELAKATPSADVVRRLVKQIEEDPAMMFSLGAIERAKDPLALPVDRLVKGLRRFEASVLAANAKLAAQPQISTTHVRLVVSRALGMIGYRDMSQISPREVPFGPQPHTAGVAARQLLEAAIMDAEAMESGLVQRRYIPVDERQRKWSNTIDALRSTTVELTNHEKRSLAPRARHLQVVYSRLKRMEKAQVTPVTNFEENEATIAEIAKALR